MRRHTVPVVSQCYGDSIMTTDKNRRSQDLRSAIQRWTRAKSPLLAGIITGFAGLAVSFGLKGANLGRHVGDPVPLMLSVTQVTDGFTYFPWRPPLTHLIFAVLLGILAFVVLWGYNLSFQTHLREDKAFITFITSRTFLLWAMLLGAAHLVFMGYEGWLNPGGWHGGIPPVSLVAITFFAAGYVVNLIGRK